MTRADFEHLLDEVCALLTKNLSEIKISGAWEFERLTREALAQKRQELGIAVDMNPPAQQFPDIVLNEFGIEVKHTKNDTWRSVANSVFEGRRKASVKHIYLLFGKCGGVPEVRWNRYEDCIMHVRTSHVPRFEVEIGTDKSLFKHLGIEYEDFQNLQSHEKMQYIREYAKGRLKPGEHLWWLEEDDSPHTLPLNVRLYTNLTQLEKRQIRAEAALLCPQVVKGRRAKGKYNEAAMFALTYHGVMTTQARDLFSAGSVGENNEGILYIAYALRSIESEIWSAASRLETRLFQEFWGIENPSQSAAGRIKHWLALLDKYEEGWTEKPSTFLFSKGLPNN